MRRFKRWLKVHVNYFDSEKEQTMDQILDEKFGAFDDYSDYTKERKEKTIVAIHNYSPEYFMDKTENHYIKHEPIGNFLILF